MAKLVYIQQIDSGTFLHLTMKGDSFCLRDYSRPADGQAREVRRQGKGETVSTILDMARKPGNHIIDAPEEPYDNFDYWKKQIAETNKQYSIPPQNQNMNPPVSEGKSWAKEIIIGIVSAVLAAIAIAWLGIK